MAQKYSNNENTISQLEYLNALTEQNRQTSNPLRNTAIVPQFEDEFFAQASASQTPRLHQALGPSDIEQQLQNLNITDPLNAMYESVWATTSQHIREDGQYSTSTSEYELESVEVWENGRVITSLRILPQTHQAIFNGEIWDIVSELSSESERYDSYVSLQLEDREKYLSWSTHNTLKKELSYKHGIINGPYRQWTREGDLITQGQFVDGYKQGYWIEPNNREVYYVDGKPWNVINRWFYSLHELSKDMFVDSGGLGSITIKSGRYEKYILFYPNGLKEKEIEESENGPYTVWYDNDQIEIDGYYEDDLKWGTWTEYYRNGKIRSKGEYFNGVRVGEWEFYDESGNRTVKTYDNKGNEIVSIQDSRKFWNLYNRVVKDPRLVPKLLDLIHPEGSTIYIPRDFDIFKVEEHLNQMVNDRYLPLINPELFQPVIEKLKQVYSRPLPEKSYL